MITKVNDNFIIEETGEIIEPIHLDFKKEDYIKAGIKPIIPMTAKEEDREIELEKLLMSEDHYAEEKLDGCFREDMRVLMMDGSMKPIKEVSKGELVKSYNERTRMWENKHVINVFDNGVGGKWLKITFKVGNLIREIVCTDNHKFFTKGKYIKATDLKAGSLLFFTEES